MEPKAENDSMFVIKPERSEVGVDVIVRNETENAKLLAPHETIELTAQIPEKYFSRNYSRTAWEFSVRSRLQQAGLNLIYFKWDGNFFRFTLSNANQNSNIIIPDEFSLGRFFVSGDRIEQGALASIVCKMENEDIRVSDDGQFLIIPIKKFAVMTSPSVDIMNLPAKRSEIDETLGFNWTNEMPNVPERTLIIGETDTLVIPKGYNGRVFRDEGNALHGQSTIIDSGFRSPIRTEFMHIKPADRPQQFVKISLSRA